jgi:hypothetical protein
VDTGDVEEVAVTRGGEIERSGQEGGHLSTGDGSIRTEPVVGRRVATLSGSGGADRGDLPLVRGTSIIAEGM